MSLAISEPETEVRAARTVYKYELVDWQLNGYAADVEMPWSAIIRHIDDQASRLCVWAEVIPNEPTHTRTFYIVGTGYPVPDGAEYIATVQRPPLVLHIYVDKVL